VLWLGANDCWRVRETKKGRARLTGNFSISYRGETTRDLLPGASEDEVAAALRELPSLAPKDGDGSRGLGGISEVQAWHGKRFTKQVNDLIYEVEGSEYLLVFSPNFTAPAHTTSTLIKKCIDPKSVDWDPEACPNAAPDLWLSYNRWYWPYFIARPTGVGSAGDKAAKMAQCAAEAQRFASASATVVFECEHKLVEEWQPWCCWQDPAGCSKTALKYNTPPCWVSRPGYNYEGAVEDWEIYDAIVTIAHRDGTLHNWTRLDWEGPTLFKKGYRYWMECSNMDECVAKARAKKPVRTNGANLVGCSEVGIGGGACAEAEPMQGAAVQQLDCESTNRSWAEVECKTPPLFTWSQTVEGGVVLGGGAVSPNYHMSLGAAYSIYAPLLHWSFGGANAEEALMNRGLLGEAGNGVASSEKGVSAVQLVRVLNETHAWEHASLFTLNMSGHTTVEMNALTSDKGLSKVLAALPPMRALAEEWPELDLRVEQLEMLESLEIDEETGCAVETWRPSSQWRLTFEGVYEDVALLVGTARCAKEVFIPNVENPFDLEAAALCCGNCSAREAEYGDADWWRTQQLAAAEQPPYLVPCPCIDPQRDVDVVEETHGEPASISFGHTGFSRREVDTAARFGVPAADKSNSGALSSNHLGMFIQKLLPAANTPVFTVEMWVRPLKLEKGVQMFEGKHMPLVSSVHSDGVGLSYGFLLTINPCGHFEFWLGMKASYHERQRYLNLTASTCSSEAAVAAAAAVRSVDVPVEGASTGVNASFVPGFSILAGSRATYDTWTHVAASFDGTHQQMYVNGSAVTDAPPRLYDDVSMASRFAPNMYAPFFVGFTNLTESLVNATDASPAYYVGDVDELLVYGTAVSPHHVRAHAGHDNTVQAAVAVKTVAGVQTPTPAFCCDENSSVAAGLLEDGPEALDTTHNAKFNGSFVYSPSATGRAHTFTLDAGTPGNHHTLSTLQLENVSDGGVELYGEVVGEGFVPANSSDEASGGTNIVEMFHTPRRAVVAALGEDRYAYKGAPGGKCPAQHVVRSVEQCDRAFDVLKLMRSRPWIGSTANLPVGCSIMNHPRLALDRIWNIGGDGASGVATPICVASGTSSQCMLDKGSSTGHALRCSVGIDSPRGSSPMVVSVDAEGRGEALSSAGAAFNFTPTISGFEPKSWSLVGGNLLNISGWGFGRDAGLLGASGGRIVRGSTVYIGAMRRPCTLLASTFSWMLCRVESLVDDQRFGSSCQCTTDGMSGPVNTGLAGCQLPGEQPSTPRNQYAGGPGFCYVQSPHGPGCRPEHAVPLHLGSIIPSQAFPGAWWRECFVMPEAEAADEQKVDPPDTNNGQALANEGYLLGVAGFGPEVAGGAQEPRDEMGSEDEDWATRPLEFSMADVGGSAKKQKDVLLQIEVKGVVADITGLCDSSKKGSNCPDVGFVREATPVLENLCVGKYCRSAWAGCRCTRWSKSDDDRRCISLDEMETSYPNVYMSYMRMHGTVGDTAQFMCQVWDPSSCNSSITALNFESEVEGAQLPSAYHLRGCDPASDHGGDYGGKNLYQATASGGSYSSEISWSVQTGTSVTQTFSSGTHAVPLADGTHTVNMYDSFGDGWNGNQWTLSHGGTVVAGPFTITGMGSFKSEDFTLSGVTTPFPTNAPTHHPTVASTTISNTLLHAAPVGDSASLSVRAINATHGTILSAGVLLPSVAGETAKMVQLLQAGSSVGAAEDIAVAASAAGNGKADGDIAREQQRSELLSLLAHGFAMSVGELGHCPLLPWADTGHVTKLSLTREVQLVGPLPMHANDTTLSTFALFFDGHPTALLPSNASAAEVESALEALPGIGALSVVRIATPEYDGMLEEGYARGGGNSSWAWAVHFHEYVGNAPNIEASVWVDAATDEEPTCLYTPFKCKDFNYTSWAQEQAWPQGLQTDGLVAANLTPPCVPSNLTNGTNVSSNASNRTNISREEDVKYRKVVEDADHWSWWPVHRDGRNLSDAASAPVFQPNCTAAPERLRAINGTVMGRYPARELVVGAVRIAIRCTLDVAEGGQQPLRVISSTFGKAMSTDAMVSVSTELHSAAPVSELTQFGGRVTFSGWGFSPVLERNRVLTDGQTCVVTGASFTTINCTTPGVEVVHIPANWSLWTPATAYNANTDHQITANSHWRINGSTLRQESLLSNDHVNGEDNTAAAAGFTLATAALTGKAHWRDYSVVTTVRRDVTPALPRGDPGCSNGILSVNNTHCCPSKCGMCGGSDCSSSPGGAAECCTGGISRSCNTAVAPCNMTAPAGAPSALCTSGPCAVGLALRYSMGAYYALTEHATYTSSGPVEGYTEYQYRLYKVAQGGQVGKFTTLLASASFAASAIDNTTNGTTAVTAYKHEIMGSVVGGGEGFGPVQLSMRANGVLVLTASDIIVNEAAALDGSPLMHAAVDDSASSTGVPTANNDFAQADTSFEAGLVGVFTAGGATASFDGVVVTHGNVNGTDGHTVQSRTMVGVYDGTQSLMPSVCSSTDSEKIADGLCALQHVVTPLRRRPELLSVFPREGNLLSAPVITLTGTFFNDTDPAHNRITVGGEPCPTISATTTELICRTPVLVAGDHAVEVVVEVGMAALSRGEGVGTEYITSDGGQRVWSERARVHRPPDCLFRQQLVIRATAGDTAHTGPAISPLNGSYYGGSMVTLRGEGFSPIAAENKVALCGRQAVECSVRSVGAGAGDGVGRGQGLLTCETGAFFDFHQGTDAFHSVTAPMAASRDLMQLTTCGSIGQTQYSSADSITFTPGYMQAMRFVNVPVPYAATVHNALINLTALTVSDEEMLTLSVRAELAGGSSKPMYGHVGAPICERNWTDARVEWRVEPWEWADDEVVTVDLSPLLHEVVNQPGWRLGNAAVLLFEGLAVPIQQLLADGTQCPQDSQPIVEDWEECESAGERLGYIGDSISHVDSYHANTDAPLGCYKSGTSGRIQFNSGEGASANQNSAGDKIICRTVPRNEQDFGLGERWARSYSGGIGVGADASTGGADDASTVLPRVINLKVDYTPANLSAVLLRAEADALERRASLEAAAANGTEIEGGGLDMVSEDGVMACDVTLNVDAEVAPLIGTCVDGGQDMAFEQPVVVTDVYFTGGLTNAENHRFEATDTDAESNVLVSDGPTDPPYPGHTLIGDGCCRGGLATSSQSGEKSTMTLAECGKSCARDERCNGFDIKGCDESAECAGSCYRYYGTGSDISAADCGYGSDQKCYQMNALATDGSSTSGEEFDFNTTVVGERAAIESAQDATGIIDATEWVELVYSLVVELRNHSRLERVSVEWAIDAAPGLGFTIEALSHPEEIASGQKIPEDMWKPMVPSGERALVAAVANEPPTMQQQDKGTCPSGFVPHENSDEWTTKYWGCCAGCPRKYRCYGCSPDMCTCVTAPKIVNGVPFGGGAYDVAVGGASVLATHVRVSAYALGPKDPAGSCLLNGVPVECPDALKGPIVAPVALASLRVYGCALESAAEAKLDGSAYEYRLDKTPTLTSISPLYGSTAGGTDVEIRGSGFAVAGVDVDGNIDVRQLTVTMERGAPHPAKVECEVQSATDSVIQCVTGAVSLRDGGWSVVVVHVQGVGNAVASGSGGDDGVRYQYVDKWSSRTTWGGNNPPAPCDDWDDDRDCKNSVWIPPGNYVMLDRSPGRLYLLLIDGSLEFDPDGFPDSLDGGLELDASYIVVKGGGTLRAGTAAAPFLHRATITLYGHVRSLELPIFGAKTLAIAGGTLALHGAPEYGKPAWTTLAEGHSALANSTTVRLSQPVLWPEGSYIVITSTAWPQREATGEPPAPAPGAHRTDPTPAPSGPMTDSWKSSRGSSSAHEVASVKAVSADGLVLTLGAPLSYDHMADVYRYPHSDLTLRMVSEVALLSRKIVVQGSGDSNQCIEVSTPGKYSCSQMGATVMVHSRGHDSSKLQAERVEFRNMGQGYRLGRFALQFYLMGKVPSSYISECSLHHSFQRGLVLHKADGLRVYGNVFYHIIGHHTHMEGGVEQGNRFENNIGILALRSTIWKDDKSPAIFSITNPKNFYNGNVAVASEGHGFYMMFYDSPGGGCCACKKKIQFEPLGLFNDNLAHSNGIDGLFIDGHHSKSGDTVMHGFTGYNNWRCGTMVAVVSKHMYRSFVLAGNRVGNLVISDANGDWGSVGVSKGLIVQASNEAAWVERFGSKTCNWNADDLWECTPKPGPLLGQIGLGLSTSHRFSTTDVSFVGYNAPHIALMPCAASAGCGTQGGFEQRFSGMKFLNCSRRHRVLDQFEIIWHDVDGSLMGADINPAYHKGGAPAAQSKGVLLAESPLTPWEHCVRATEYQPYYPDLSNPNALERVISLPLVRCDSSAVTFHRISVRLVEGSAKGRDVRLFWGDAAQPAPPVPDVPFPTPYRRSIEAAATVDTDGVNNVLRSYSTWLRPYAWEKGIFGEYKPSLASGRSSYGPSYPFPPDTYTTPAYTFVMHMGARVTMKWDGYFTQLYPQGDCCRYNNKQVFMQDFGEEGSRAQCEAMCWSNPRCKFYSHAAAGVSSISAGSQNYHHRCMLCSACEVSGDPPSNEGEGRFFSSHKKTAYNEVSSYQVVVSETQPSDHFWLSTMHGSWRRNDTWGRLAWHAHVDQRKPADATGGAGNYPKDDPSCLPGSPHNKAVLGACSFAIDAGDEANAAGLDPALGVDMLPGIRHADWPGMVALKVPPLSSGSGTWLFDYDYDDIGGVMTHLWKASDAFAGLYEGNCNVDDNGKGGGYENAKKAFPCEHTVDGKPAAGVWWRKWRAQRIYPVIILPCPNVDTISRPEIVDSFGRSLPGFTMPGQFPNTQMVVGEFIWDAGSLADVPSSKCDSGTHTCFRACPEPPPPPPPPPPPEYVAVLLENETRYWSNATTWDTTQTSLFSPFNTLKYDERNYPPAPPEVVVTQSWNASTPGNGDNVWIIPLRTVVLDEDTAALRGLIIDEGANLVFSHERSVSLTAAFVTIRGGSMLVCEWQCTPKSIPEVTMDCSCGAPYPAQRTATINLLGDRFAPRIPEQPWLWWPPTLETMETPPSFRESVARRIRSAMYHVDNAKTLTVNGVLNLWGAAQSHSWTQLSQAAAFNATEIVVGTEVDWAVGMAVLIAGTGYHNAGSDRNEVRTIVQVVVAANGESSALTLDAPLQHEHHASVETYGANDVETTDNDAEEETEDDDEDSGTQHTIDMRAEVALLTRNIIVQGTDQQSTWAGAAAEASDATYEWPSDTYRRGKDGRYFYELTDDSSFGGRLAVFTLEEEVLWRYGSFIKDFVGTARITNVQFERMGRSAFLSQKAQFSTNHVNNELQQSPLLFGSFPAVEFGQNGKGGPRSFVTNSSVVSPFGEGIVKTGCKADYLLFQLTPAIDRGGTGKQEEPKVRSKWCADSGLSVMANTVFNSKGSSFKLEMPCDPDGRRLTGTDKPGSAGCSYGGAPDGIGRGEALSVFEGNLAVGMRAGPPRMWWKGKRHPTWRPAMHVDAAFDFSSPHGVLVKDNVAAGGGVSWSSHSVGFVTGGHKDCRGGTLAEGWFVGNRAHSLQYGVVVSPTSACVRLDRVSIYKAAVAVHVFPEAPLVGNARQAATMVLARLRIADCGLGVGFFLIGADAAKHVRVDTWATVQDSLFVGRSQQNYDCSVSSLTGMLPVVFVSPHKNE
jgi:hypothetical protein